MKARANTENKFLYKYLLIGIGTLLFSLYGFYDAAINYPSQRPAVEAYEKLDADIEKRKADAGEVAANWAEVRESEWGEIAQSNGWSPKKPYFTSEKLDSGIQFSWFIFAVCALMCIPCFLWFLKNRGTWIEIDGTRLSSSNGQSLDFSEIQTLDKKKWEKKGLAKITYSDEGVDKTFVVDDLKYERKIVDQMVGEIESAISADKIINGLTEIEIAKKLEEKRVAREARLKELEGADTD